MMHEQHLTIVSRRRAWVTPAAWIAALGCFAVHIVSERAATVLAGMCGVAIARFGFKIEVA